MYFVYFWCVSKKFSSSRFHLLPDWASRSCYSSRNRRAHASGFGLRMGSSSSTLKLPRKSPRSSSSRCKPSEEAIAQAMALKDIGNEHFKAGRFKEADQLYSQAYVTPRGTADDVY